MLLGAAGENTSRSQKAPAQPEDETLPDDTVDVSVATEPATGTGL